mgnify:CR=1 FL=1
MNAVRTLAPLLLLLLSTAPPLLAQHEHAHAGAGKLGRVVFPVSCAAAVGADFERGVAMLHSFWFGEAEKAFQAVAAADPQCAMAHWGIALARRGNPFAGAPAAANLTAGLAAAEQAVRLAAGAPPRERGYVDAVLAFYRGHEQRDHRTRMLAYEEAMRQLREHHPDDREATIFYAQAVIANAPPSDLKFERQQVAAGMLEPLFAQEPQHPGLAHYLIHAYDAPPLAERGLAAAQRYAGIAPAAPHALHMPSHIFTRRGLWDESIASNTAAAKAEGSSPGRVHPLDYLVYAYLQQGRDREAEAVARAAAATTGSSGYAPIMRYNALAMPARLVLERARWAEAARLPLPEAGTPPEFAAIARFARGVGAARSGQAAPARREAAELSALEQALTQRGDAYWATLVGAQRLAVEAWLARAERRDADALRLARQAADREETVEKHPVTPGPLLPARELLGDLLLELGHADDAQAAYEATLRHEPNRARTLYGAARAAERAGDRAAARAHYRALAKLMARADAERPERRAALSFRGR